MNSLNECLLLLKLCHESTFLETKEMNKEGKDFEFQMNILNSNKQMSNQMQQLYYYVNCLSSNDIFDAATRHHFIRYNYKDLHNQYE